MSRCFTFPPPGYEKKITTTDSDFLKKEKHREKKQRKEKKDREKKDDKEKKDKDRSDEKSREKKDKKEKNRDKKKEKARDKNNQTHNPSLLGEARDKVQPEGRVGLIVNQKNLDTYNLLDDSRSSGKYVGYNEQILGCYASLDDKPNGVKSVQDFDSRSRNDTLMHHQRNEGGGTFYRNNHLANNFGDSNLALELDRRLKNEAEQPYHQYQTPNKLTGAPQKRDSVVIKSASLDVKERGDNRIKGASGYDQAKPMGIKMVPIVSKPAQSNHDRMPTPLLANNAVMKTEGQESTNHQEDKLQQRGKKRKDKDRNGEKKSHGIKLTRDKEKEEEKGNNRGDQNKAAQGTREDHKMDTLCTPIHELHTGKFSRSNMPKEEELNQTKELLKNEIHHVTGSSKLSRPSSIHSHNDNGRALEVRQIPVKRGQYGQGATDIFKVDKAGKVNGVIENHVLRPATEQVVQAQSPSPHPDAKRLNEILSVPKMDELSELDDLNWLFSSKERPEKKVRMDDSHAGTSAYTPQVWSKATNIDSADVYALPYVIPY